jgi:flagellar protein FliJ
MQTLILLLKHAELDRDAALANCETANRAERACTAQLSQLEGYRSDYEARWNQQFSQGGEMNLVRCYHDFMARLNQAVDQQRNALQMAARQREAAQTTLRERELRVASVSKLMERRSREIRLGFERREQKQFDEMSARIVRMRPSGMDFLATR